MGEYQDVTPDVGPMLRAPVHPVAVAAKYRPMRGQAYVVRHPRASSSLVLLDDPKKEIVHRGTVLDLGEPGTLDGHPDSPIVPWDIRIGDVVWFTLGVWLDAMRTLEFVGVNGAVVVLAQSEIHGVET
jgi:hypothetical protein